MRLREIPPKRTFILQLDEQDLTALQHKLEPIPAKLTTVDTHILEDLLEQIQALNPIP